MENKMVEEQVEVEYLSPQIHQEYTFRHRSACRIPAESEQEYLTNRKEYIDPHKTQDQALSLWSGSTESNTLDYQRTNPRGQIVRTHTKETTVIEDLASPNHQQRPVQDASSKQQTKQKYKPSHQQTGLPPHSALPFRGKINQPTNRNSAQTSPYTKLTQTTGPSLEGRNQKEERIQL